MSLDFLISFLKTLSFSYSRSFRWNGSIPKISMPTKPIPPPPPPPPKAGPPFPTLKDFMLAIKPFAQVVEVKYGIPWRLTAAHAAHESRNGNSKLTVVANNLFGVTGDSWKKIGRPVYEIETKEFNGQGLPYMVVRPFRRYQDWTEALSDWVSLIMRIYPHAYDAAIHNDAEKFFDGLQAGGYATDNKYAAKLKARYSEVEALA